MKKTKIKKKKDILLTNEQVFKIIFSAIRELNDKYYFIENTLKILLSEIKHVNKKQRKTKKRFGWMRKKK